MDVGVKSGAVTLGHRNGRIEKVDDGPESGMRKEIGNVSIIEAQNMEKAIEEAKRHPALSVADGEVLGLSVEIHEVHTYEVK